MFDETIRSHDKQYRRNTLENPGRAASLAAFKPAVEDRRAFAKIIAAPFEREKTVDARARFVELQATIEAIDRAIDDEEGGQGSV